MKLKTPILTTILITSSIYLLTQLDTNPTPPVKSISSENKPNPSLESISRETYIIDTNRLNRMSYLLDNYSRENYQEYKDLCNRATQPPKLGMNFDQSRNSTWCFPYTRHKTTNNFGEYVQEVYLKNIDNPSYSGRKYLYFNNGILISIQE